MRRRLLRTAAAGALFAALIVPATASADTISLKSGDWPVTYLQVIPTGSAANQATGPAVKVPAHPAWATIPGTDWINWAADRAPNPGPLAGPEGPALCIQYGYPQEAGVMDYTLHFTLPTGFTDPSLSGLLHADNAAAISLNGEQIASQPIDCDPDNFQGGPFSFTTTSLDLVPPFQAGENTIVIRNYDWGVAAGIDFDLAVSYEQEDVTPPTLTLPEDFTTEATQYGGATVTFTATASDDVDPSVSPVCEPASGDVFPLGQTAVTCNATDSAGNTAEGSFTVTVVPGPPYLITFLQQPTQTQVDTAINPAVSVRVEDQYGNLNIGEDVDMAIGTNPGGGTLHGTTTQTTGADGTATFGNLSIDEVGLGYTLLATSGTATRTSDPFLIADSVTQCGAGAACSGSASNEGTSLSVEAAGASGFSLGTASGDTFSTASGDYTLGIALLPRSVPENVCGPTFGVGEESFVGLSEVGPTLVVTWQLDKSLVKQRPGNRGAAHFDICLGAVYVGDPGRTFRTKGGGMAKAVRDPVFDEDRYWGLLPDCAKKEDPEDPCVLQRKKSRAGDAFVAFLVPSPWDPHIIGG